VTHDDTIATVELGRWAFIEFCLREVFMRRLRLLPLSVLLLACEGSPSQVRPMTRPTPDEVFLAAADPEFHLSAAERARIPPAINADQLEALLSRVRPEYRDELLKGFEQLVQQGRISIGPASSTVPDPLLQELIRGISTPMRASAKQNKHDDH
jgi:hypothetical protein